MLNSQGLFADNEYRADCKNKINYLNIINNSVILDNIILTDKIIISGEDNNYLNRTKEIQKGVRKIIKEY